MVAQTHLLYTHFESTSVTQAPAVVDFNCIRCQEWVYSEFPVYQDE